MATVLVVANETLGGRKLIEAVKARAQKGDATFVVVAPQNRPKAGYVVYDESVRDAAQHRVDTTIAQLREVGVEASGEVMDPDPYHAIIDAVGEFGADEIIISTHPEGRSHWLEKGIVEAARERFAVPITHVVVDLEAELRAPTA